MGDHHMEDKKPKSNVPAQRTEPPAPVGVPIFDRGNFSFVHHLVKLMPAKMKKNFSFNPHQPKIVEIEHCHFFHSVDSKGTPQTKTNMVGGHYHDVTMVMGKDADGKEVLVDVKIGPPLKQGYKRLQSGRQVKSATKISWVDESVIKGEDDEPLLIEDNHEHQWHYYGKETISARRTSNLFVPPSAPSMGSRAGIDIREG